MNHCNRNFFRTRRRRWRRRRRRRRRLQNLFSAVSRKKLPSDFAEKFSEQREKIGKLGEIRFFSPLQKQKLQSTSSVIFSLKRYSFIFSNKSSEKKITFGPKCLVSNDFELFSVTVDRFPSFRDPNPSRHLNEKRNHVRLFLATGALQKKTED